MGFVFCFSGPVAGEWGVGWITGAGTFVQSCGA
jgi:hypothetical protein